MWRWIIVVFLVSMISETEEIKNARLILPRIVRAGTSTTFICLYDLEKAPLYSVQWYRGRYEFFRYVRNESPPFKVFSIPGIYVDVFSSNENQVTLRNIPTHISGEISCEITADAPYFSTSCVSSNLTVIELDLDFKISQKRVSNREIISANCTASPPSQRIGLSFHLDDKEIPEEFIVRRGNSAIFEMNATSLDSVPSIDMDPLELRCSAFLDGFYYVTGKTISIQLQKLNDRFDRLSNSSNFKKSDFICKIVFIFLIFNLRDVNLRCN